MKGIIAELKEIASAAGDNMDREGEYTSDRIRMVIDTLNALDLLKAAEEVEAAMAAEETYRWEQIGSYPDVKIPTWVREKWLEDLKVIATRQIAARYRLKAAITKAKE